MLSKFLNTKTLIILLAILIVAYLISKLTEREDRTFKSEIVEVDTADITKIAIIPKIGGGDDIVFTKTGHEWKLESGGKFYKPDNSAVKNILSELIRMKSERVAATDDSRWKEFEVTDSTGTRIKLYDGKKVVSDLFIGKFSYTQPKGPQNPYQQNKGKMSTCVRPADDDEVYVVDGFIKMSIQSNVDSYRDKTLCATKKEDLTKITFKYPDNKNYTLIKKEDKWFLNGQPTDSTKTDKYLNKLARVIGSEFIDDVEPLSNTLSHYVKIEGNNLLPVEIKAFPADSVYRFVIVSSLIPDSKFSGEKGKLFERVFPKYEDFFAEEE